MVCSLLNQVCNGFSSADLFLMLVQSTPIARSWQAEEQLKTEHDTEHRMTYGSLKTRLPHRKGSIIGRCWHDKNRRANLETKSQDRHFALSRWCSCSQLKRIHTMWQSAFIDRVLLDNILSSNRFCHGEKSPCEKDVPSLS